jgi:hypothetical protein
VVTKARVLLVGGLAIELLRAKGHLAALARLER